MPVDIELVPPTLALRDEVADCLADFAGTPVDGSGITDPSRTPRTDDELSVFVAPRLAEEGPTTELAAGASPQRPSRRVWRSRPGSASIPC